MSRQALLYRKHSARGTVSARKGKQQQHTSWNLVFYERQRAGEDLVLFSSDQDIEHNNDGKNQVT